MYFSAQDKVWAGHKEQTIKLGSTIMGVREDNGRCHFRKKGKKEQSCWLKGGALLCKTGGKKMEQVPCVQRQGRGPPNSAAKGARLGEKNAGEKKV